jgi:hypothetical protein
VSVSFTRLLFFLLLSAPLVGRGQETVETRLKDYYSAIARKEVTRAVSYFHPGSAKLERAKAEFEQFTKEFDLSYLVSDFKEIGRADGDIVVSFVEQTTFSAPGGEKLNTFTAKVLMVWRKDQSGAYKIWDSLALRPATAEKTNQSKN